MREILRTNDVVLLSLIESLFEADDVRFFVADRHMSVLEGSTGFLQRRLLVAERDLSRARRLLIDAGFTHELAAE